MKNKTVRERKSARELGLSGQTVGETMLDLIKKCPELFSKAVLPGCVMEIEKDFATNLVKIVFSDGMEISEFQTEKISEMAAKTLLAQWQEQQGHEKRNIEIRVHLKSISESAWITNGHLPWSIENRIIRMNPQICAADDSFIRTIVPHTDDLYNMDQYLHKKPQNRILKRSEPVRDYPEIIRTLGFEMQFKENSTVQINEDGEEDTCVVTRICPYPDEIKGNDQVIKCVIDTIEKTSAIEENPIVKIRMENFFDITVHNNRKELTMTIPAHKDDESSKYIENLIGNILETVGITGTELKKSVVEYNTTIQVEDTILDKFLKRAGEFAGSIVEGAISVVESARDIRDKYGEKIVAGATLLSMPLIFMYLLLNKATNPDSSWFEAVMTMLPAFCIAYFVSVIMGGGAKLLEVFEKKRFPLLFWLCTGITYIVVSEIGFLAYFKALLYIFLILTILVIVAIFAYAILLLISYLTEPLREYLEGRKVAEKIIHSGSLAILARIILIFIGIIIAIVFNIAAIPLKVICSINVFRDRSYWREIEQYQINIIESSIDKKRVDLNLAIPCKIYVNLKNCRKFKNPFRGGLKVLRRRMPDFLTWEGYIELNKNLVRGNWM